MRRQQEDSAERRGPAPSGPGQVVGWPLAVGVGLLVLPLLYAACTHVWLTTGSIRSAGAIVVGMPVAMVAMMLPGVALWMIVRRRWHWGGGIAVGTLTVVSGATVLAWVCLWVAIANPTLGHVAYSAVYIVSVGVVTVHLRAELRRLATIAAVLGIGVAACLTATGIYYAHGGLGVATEIASNGTFGTTDNLFPQYWVQRIEHHQDLRPFEHGWPLADRPPVQSALVLPLMWMGTTTHGNPQVAYQLPSVVLQGLVVTAAAALLLQLGLTRRRRSAALVLVVLTPFLEYNTVFVWPKLLAAAYLMLAIAVLFEDDDAIQGPTWLLVGAAVALSLLAHPGSVFSLPALVVVLVALWRRRVVFGRWTVAVLSLFGVLLPWGLYRLFYDHSTSPLLKEHLAGILDHGDRRGVLRSIVDEYRSLGVVGWIRNRIDNLRDLVWRPGRKHLPESWSGRVLTLDTFSALWSGGLLLLATPLLFVRRLPRNVRLMALAGLVATLVWTLIEFGKPNADAITHQGPYAAFLLIDIALAAAVARLLPRWGLVTFVVAQVAIWVWLTYPLAHYDHCLITQACIPHTYPRGTVREGRLLVPLAAVSVLGFAALVAGMMWVEPGAPAGSSPPGADAGSQGREASAAST